MSTIREREDDEAQDRSAKRSRLEDELTSAEPVSELTSATSVAVPTSSAVLEPTANSDEDEQILPKSHALLSAPSHAGSGSGDNLRIRETDVGISEYVGHDIPKIEGIIKQRFTDFLVYEVDMDGNVVHIKSLKMPESSKKNKDADETPSVEASSSGLPEKADVDMTATMAGESSTAADAVLAPEEPKNLATATPEQPMDVKKPTPGLESVAPPIAGTNSAEAPEDSVAETPVEDSPWPERFTVALSKYMSDGVISQLKTMYLEGPEPPFVSDDGWASRPGTEAETGGDATVSRAAVEPEPESSGRGGRGRGRGGRGARGGRGGRGGARGGRPAPRIDNRKVLSDPIDDKTTRTGLHKTVRELFGGKLDSETEANPPEDADGARIVIKWSKQGVTSRGGRPERGGGRGRGNPRGGGERAPRGTYPSFIHFTLQKTNRDTQDALGHLARTIHVNVKDLSVAGTKDKRGVTVQRVSLWRGSKTVEDVWKFVHGQNGRRWADDALKQRGERGIRVADFNYRKARLELGMLKGNAFVITLRNLQVDSMDTLDRAMNTIKYKGFINYYGMQRFGTASIPTHSIGLALLKAEWQKAVSMILRKRPGEHPDVEAARDAWHVEHNLDKALALMPRRVVAERCILESYQRQKGETRNAFGALSTIPRNLRLMYVHAYQSYLWNAIVSERIRMYGAEKPAVGDLVYAADTDDNATKEGSNDDEEADDTTAEPAEASEEASPAKKGKKPWKAPLVKTLATEDLDKYTIFDVIMPLPGRDVDYPGGALGERYQELIRTDGLDPSNWTRPQKEYSLGGSYRHIMHMPKELSWTVLRYTDPDVPLAQADEDALLGFDAPAIVPDGRFTALQVRLQLGTAAYATMALREVTKTETSSHFQTSLTLASEDQKFKGATDGVEKADEMEV